MVLCIARKKTNIPFVFAPSKKKKKVFPPFCLSIPVSIINKKKILYNFLFSVPKEIKAQTPPKRGAEQEANVRSELGER